MYPLFQDLYHYLTVFWWPFLRMLAALSYAPILGENNVPVRVRIALAIVLAIAVSPGLVAAPAVDPLSLSGVALAVEQLAIGFSIGFALYLVNGVLQLSGQLVSMQIGLSMASMNDPMNGEASGVLSQLFIMLGALIFFAVDGHLLLVTVVHHSFQQWPLGQGWNLPTLSRLAMNAGWIFSAAFLLAIPSLFSTLVVQIGFGLLNRVAPALNLYSLGFPLILLFGLFTLGMVVHTLPQHYLHMTERVLESLRSPAALMGAAHG